MRKKPRMYMRGSGWFVRTDPCKAGDGIAGPRSPGDTIAGFTGRGELFVSRLPWEIIGGDR